jgi:hypothetical protein
MGMRFGCVRFAGDRDPRHERAARFHLATLSQSYPYVPNQSN